MIRTVYRGNSETMENMSGLYHFGYFVAVSLSLRPFYAQYSRTGMKAHASVSLSKQNVIISKYQLK